ncbi:glycoside hydrolase family 3 C-terminal domain-containing protein [Streptomyces sp. DSM 41972]|uniref:Glycoside hydrolase family 3 C-terminal domain-containing protein n=1 Tax=Streptomyces althioticus subsp. attaecolombicae TaxID=3075534 RepID=A0ABU3I1R3_9ACTN|nr:glycoside hydrolase family 3 C-terminal domain-containing protein [Streptomyces sp. DSM 41972]SCD56541.1 beta-glucosidase [Streptomyces sp. di50b]SCE37711.1 beta-glucosidase [Streptomyces sp. di188]
MNRRTFLSAAAFTALAASMAPAVTDRAVAAPRSVAQDRAAELLARMTAAEKEALVRCDFDAVAHLGIPALTMVDASAGLRGETGVTAFPVPVAQAATFDEALAGRIGKAIGAEGRAKGYNNALGPTIDLTRTWHFGRQAEAMGEDPVLAGRLGAALTVAIQSQHMAATLKHFAAYTQEVNRFFTDTKVSDRALHEYYQAPFRRVIAAAPATSVMMAYPKINGTFATRHTGLFDDLKKGMGLQGYTVPDFWAGDDQVAAARAGMDLAGLGPGGVQIPAGSLTGGAIPAARLDDAARRILVTMFANGLFDHPVPAPAGNVSTQAHKDLAHEAAVASTVLLANRSQALPLTGAVKSLAVIGPAGSDTFTGVSGSTYVDPGSWTTPLDAIRARAGRSVKVTHAQGTKGDLPLTTVPSTVLRTPTGAAGLRASYYAGADGTGTPVTTRTEATVDFAAAPVEGLPQVWSATWTGTLTPTTTGLHRFSLLPSGTTSLKIDGRTVVSGTRQMARFFLGPYDYPLQGTAELTAGRPVTVEITYTNATAEPGTCGLTLGWQPESLIPAAVKAARAADAAVVFVNRVAGEGMDHDGYALPGDQDQLVAAVAAVNPRTIVVLNTDGPVATPWLNDVEAVVQAWYAGRGAGTAVAAVLFGDSDPAGRLPVTFPADATQGPGTTPATYPGTNGTVAYDEGIAVGYRYYDARKQEPRFPFGHGLSYTTFAHGSLEVTYDKAARQVVVEVTVTNTGRREGTEVVQVYATLPASAAAEPRRLVAFRKVTLPPAGSRRLRLTIPVEDLGVWSSGALTLTPGVHTFATARSSRVVTAQRALTLG